MKEMLEAEKNAEYAGTRKNQVGSGDRSERIRTYNFPQGRVTDHRINLTLHKLDAILEGQLEEIIEALVAHDRRALETGGVSGTGLNYKGIVDMDYPVF